MEVKGQSKTSARTRGKNEVGATELWMPSNVSAAPDIRYLGSLVFAMTPYQGTPLSASARISQAHAGKTTRAKFATAYALPFEPSHMCARTFRQITSLHFRATNDEFSIIVILLSSAISHSLL